MKKILFYSFFIFYLGISLAQNRAIDSLKKSLRTTKEDSNKVNTLISLCWPSREKFPEAIGYATEAFRISENIHFVKGRARALYAMGLIHYVHGNYTESLSFFLRALRLFEEMGNKQAIADTYTWIGNVYVDQNNLRKAEEYHMNSLQMNQELRNKKNIAICYDNIGTILTRQQEYQKALEKFFEYQCMSKEVGDKPGYAISFENIGEVYSLQGKYEDALSYTNEALALFTKIHNNGGICRTNLNLGTIYLKLANYSKARMCLENGLSIAKQINAKKDLQLIYKTLSSLDSAQAKWASAYQNFKFSVIYADSLHNEEETKKTVRLEMNYEFEKKEAAAKLDQEKKEAIAVAESKKQQIIIYSVCGILILVFAFALFAYRSYLQKQKANIEITRQHKEITDSINYAERIQRSFLATAQLLDSNLKEYFVFFQPKDIVSGDFYWASKLSNDQFAIVTADSTGHGVPGAIMSILNISSLEKAVEERRLVEPSEILNHTRIKIIERLKKDGSPEGGKDGMDCSLISYDFKNLKMTYSAANNPVMIVRNNQILEFAADKMPVGKHDRDTVSFTQHSIDLQNGDVVYAITDGMPDQFGGPMGKKFKYKKLKELFISIAHLSMQEQKEILGKTLENWKGHLEQVDDITIVGVKII